jgi:hypothetical protein
MIDIVLNILDVVDPSGIYNSIELYIIAATAAVVFFKTSSTMSCLLLLEVANVVGSISDESMLLMSCFLFVLDYFRELK